jgi:hypothetical protein
MEEIRYKVSAQHANSRAYRHFYGQEPRAPGMEGRSGVTTMLGTAIHYARIGAAMLAERLARRLSRTPTDSD